MPEINGFQTTIQKRQREPAQHHKPIMPMIALNADAKNGIVGRCLNAGMDNYFTKSFSKQQLQDMLERWITNKQTEPDDKYT